MIEEIFWAMMPSELEEWFEVKGYEKTEKGFRIILEEKNIPGKLPPEYQGRKIINNVLREKTLEDFPIRGRKTEIIIRRRYWKFEGVKKWYRREITITAAGTKIEQEFADFLKEFDRQHPDSDLPGRYVEPSKLEKLRETVQE